MRSESTLARVGLRVVVGWALVANLARLSLAPWAFDEPGYAQAAWRYIHGDGNRPPTGVFSNLDNFEHPPFAKYLFGVAQLVAGHPSVAADRIVAALCTLGTATVLGMWLARLTEPWIGLVAAALVTVLPMSVPHFDFRFGRYGYLDPVAELFAVGAVVLAWEWFQRSGRHAWVFAVATGACVGLAAASKENGFLGAVGPALVGILLAARAWRTLVSRLLQASAAIATFGLVFATTYLGFGHPVGAFRFMLRYQREHAKLGHRVAFAGHTAVHPPGWAFLWFAQHGIGTFVAVLCLLCVVAAIVLRHDRLVLWCVAALAGPLLFHMVIARIVLSFYWVMWMPAFLALVALGLGELVRIARSLAVCPRRDARLLAAVTAALCAATFTVSSAGDTFAMLTKNVAEHSRITYAGGVQAHAPLVYLRLDERSGTVAADASREHHDASYVGAPALGTAGLLSGDQDRAAGFDGSGAYASVPGATWMNVADYSVVVWFRTTSTGQFLVSHDDYARAKVWDVLVDSFGRIQFWTFRPGDGAGQSVVSPHGYNDGRRHMLMCIKSGSTQKLYIDGRLVASAQFATFVQDPSPTLDIDLARRGNGTGYLRGTLDEFAFYGRALSAVDALALYLLGTLPPQPS